MRYGHYQYLLIPLGLATAPATFNHTMNVILAGRINHGILGYIDDILIYLEHREGYVGLTREVLHRLKENNLVIAPNKHKWDQKSVVFLEYLKSGEGVNKAKIEIGIILKREIPQSVKEV
jgi:hypothetical protein